MSQANVERVIGVLATDERMRRQFSRDPAATLRAMIESGTELTECERHALTHLDPRDLRRFADAIDARLQKSDLSTGLLTEEHGLAGDDESR